MSNAHPRTRNSLMTRGTAMLMACLAGGAAANANIFDAYVDETNFSWRITNMPDFDQKRAAWSNPFIMGLPGDGGMYCVPTATVNLLGYIARHGYPGVSPGIENWEDSQLATYNEATWNLAVMGVMMNTDADDGTGSLGWYNGARNWLNVEDFDVGLFGVLNTWAPKTSDIAELSHNGAITAFVYGRYEHDGYELTERTGGHAVTTTRLEKDSPFLSTIWYRNPSNSSNLYSQATFSDQTLDCLDLYFTRDGKTRKYSRMEFEIDDPDDDRWRIIDGVLAIFPREGLTNWPQLNDAVVLFGGNGFAVEPPTTHWDVPHTEIVDMALSPTHTEYAFTATDEHADGGALYVIRKSTGAISSLRTLVSTQAIFPVEYSRQGDIFVVDGPELIRYRKEDDGRYTELMIPLPGGHQISSMAFDDETDQLIMLSPLSGKILRAGLDLQSPVEVDDLPNHIELGLDSQLAPARKQGSVIVFTGLEFVELSKTDELPRWTQTDSFQPPYPEMSSPQVDNRGHVLFVGDGKVREFEKNAETGEWIELHDTLFAGRPAGPILRISRSRTNYDPAEMSGPGWNNIDPDELLMAPEAPGCPGDLNGDLVVDILDLNMVLGNFSGDSFQADANHDGVVNILDLNLVLGNFSNTCD